MQSLQSIVQSLQSRMGLCYFPRTTMTITIITVQPKSCSFAHWWRPFLFLDYMKKVVLKVHLGGERHKLPFYLFIAIFLSPPIHLLCYVMFGQTPSPFLHNIINGTSLKCFPPQIHLLWAPINPGYIKLKFSSPLPPPTTISSPLLPPPMHLQSLKGSHKRH